MWLKVKIHAANAFFKSMKGKAVPQHTYGGAGGEEV
jgi:hypothetical protein